MGTVTPMRAMLLRKPDRTSTRPLEAADLPSPLPGAGEIVLAVKACAVCRTDLQEARGDVAVPNLPIVPGHQVVGQVTAVGPGVTRWRVGDRAGVGWLGWACGVCRLCESGQENLCARARFTGRDLDGGYAQELRVAADFALSLPPGFDDVSAAPLLCGGVIGYRSLVRSAIRPGGRLGLYGYGASARLAIQVALHWRCEVFVCTRDPRDRDEARKAGAAWVGGADEPPPRKLDAAVTFAPVGSAVIAALKALDRGGTVAVNAIHLDGIPAFDYDDLWLERQIVSVANFTRRDAQDFLALAAELPIRAPHVELPLGEANQALVAHEAGTLEGTAVLIP
jgi:alcohol dehydrogenase, propanol-preferring